MCMFGTEYDILEDLIVPEESPIIGVRNWKLSIENGKLMSEYRNFVWDKIIHEKDLKINNSKGIYAYHNYSYSYYYYNYYNNNYYNNNYNYSYYYNYNNYNYNYNYKYGINYYIFGTSAHWGRAFKYKNGLRSEYAKPIKLAILNDDWFNSNATRKFAESFNELIKKVAESLDCETEVAENLIGKS